MLLDGFESRLGRQYFHSLNARFATLPDGNPGPQPLGPNVDAPYVAPRYRRCALWARKVSSEADNSSFASHTP